MVRIFAVAALLLIPAGAIRCIAADASKPQAVKPALNAEEQGEDEGSGDEGQQGQGEEKGGSVGKGQTDGFEGEEPAPADEEEE